MPRKMCGAGYENKELINHVTIESVRNFKNKIDYDIYLRHPFIWVEEKMLRWHFLI